MGWYAGFLSSCAELFHQEQLLTGQFFDPPLVAGDHGFAFPFNNAVQQGFNLPVDLGYTGLELGAAGIAGGAFALRQGVQVSDKAFERCPVRCDLRNDRVEVRFKIGAADGFSVAGAARFRAQVVRMLVAGLAGGPAGRQRRSAIGAEHKAAQREIGVNVFPGGRFGADAQALLNPFVGCERNQAIMLSFTECHAPARQFQVSGIKRLGQQVLDALIADFACRKVIRIVRLAFKKALNLNL